MEVCDVFYIIPLPMCYPHFFIVLVPQLYNARFRLTLPQSTAYRFCTRGELTSIARMGMPVQRRGRIHSGQQPTRQDSPTGLPHDFAARTDRVAAAPPPPAAWCVQMESCHGEGWHSETGCPVPSEAPGRPKTRFGVSTGSRSRPSGKGGPRASTLLNQQCCSHKRR